MTKNLPNEEKKPIAKKVWFLLGLPAFATIIAIIGLAVTMVQNGILSVGSKKDTAAMLTEAVEQNVKAATLVSLQEI
jgi:hypothetical protein